MPSGSVASLFSSRQVDERNTKGMIGNVGGGPTPQG